MNLYTMTIDDLFELLHENKMGIYSTTMQIYTDVTEELMIQNTQCIQKVL